MSEQVDNQTKTLPKKALMQSGFNDAQALYVASMLFHGMIIVIGIGGFLFSFIPQDGPTMNSDTMFFYYSILEIVAGIIGIAVLQALRKDIKALKIFLLVTFFWFLFLVLFPIFFEY